jgi:HAD superfamily hydrolase (TIGR01549 family)
VARPKVRWIVFDVGETLIDETRMWNEWADLLGVPRFTFAAALGAVIARGQDHRRVFDLVAPGVDWRVLRNADRPSTWPSRIEPADVYPDVVQGIESLRSAGFLIGIAGNQPTTTEEALARIGIPFDLVGSSETYRASKPDRLFYERLVAATAASRSEIAYVGDRVENDVEPAIALGLQGVLLRRGPWATIGTGSLAAVPGMATIERIDDLLDVFDVAGRTRPTSA